MRFQFSALNGKLLNTFLQFLSLFILFYYVCVWVGVCVFPLLFVSRIPISHFAFRIQCYSFNGIAKADAGMLGTFLIQDT